MLPRKCRLLGDAPSPLRGGLGRGARTGTFRAILKGGRDGIVNAIGVEQDVLIGKAQHLEASRRQIVVARPVIGLCQLAIVAIAIDLNDELGVPTGEVDIIGPNLDLLAEVKAASTHGPEQVLYGSFGTR